jgi:hypothetical protein
VSTRLSRRAALLAATLPATTRIKEGQAMADHPYLGLWVTADRRVRHRLLPNGRYDEARGSRESAYQGRYELHGHRILYWDDTGFTADGEFRGDVFHHGGMVFYRDGAEPR